MAEWQTQTTQNRSGNHVGSSPTIGTPSQNSLESKDFRLFFFFAHFLYFGVFWEDIDDCIRRRYLTGEIQMCINVACRADVAVPQPLLNLLQAHAIGIEQTGAAMAQIVKADTLHLVCDQKIREMLAQEIGPNPFSHRVYIDIVKIIGAIAFAADLPILLLLLFHFIEHLLTGRD